MPDQSAVRCSRFELNQTAQLKIGNFNVHICLPKLTVTELPEGFGKCSGVFTVQGQCGCKTTAEHFTIPTLPLCGSVYDRSHGQSTEGNADLIGVIQGGIVYEVTHWTAGGIHMAKRTEGDIKLPIHSVSMTALKVWNISILEKG